MVLVLGDKGHNSDAAMRSLSQQPHGSKGSAEIYVSLAAFRSTKLILAVLDNTLTYVQPKRLALHTSADSDDVAGIVSDPRVVHNPQHTAVRRHSSQPLAIHMSNFELLLALPSAERPKGRDRILLLPGNAVLFRDCAPMLHRAPMSLAHQHFTDVEFSMQSSSRGTAKWKEPCYLENDGTRNAHVNRMYGCKCSSEPEGAQQAWGTRLPPPPSAAWEFFMDAVRQQDDAMLRHEVQCSKNHFFRTWFEWAGQSQVAHLCESRPQNVWASAAAGLYERRPLVSSIHAAGTQPRCCAHLSPHQRAPRCPSQTSAQESARIEGFAL